MKGISGLEGLTSKEMEAILPHAPAKSPARAEKSPERDRFQGSLDVNWSPSGDSVRVTVSVWGQDYEGEDCSVDFELKKSDFGETLPDELGKAITRLAAELVA